MIAIKIIMIIVKIRKKKLKLEKKIIIIPVVIKACHNSRANVTDRCVLIKFEHLTVILEFC